MAGGYLSGIFGDSPVRPLQEHMGIVVKCGEELVSFTKAAIDGDRARLVSRH